jgi:hypothetical protein
LIINAFHVVLHHAVVVGAVVPVADVVAVVLVAGALVVAVVLVAVAELADVVAVAIVADALAAVVLAAGVAVLGFAVIVAGFVVPFVVSFVGALAAAGIALHQPAACYYYIVLAVDARFAGLVAGVVARLPAARYYAAVAFHWSLGWYPVSSPLPYFAALVAMPVQLHLFEYMPCHLPYPFPRPQVGPYLL